MFIPGVVVNSETDEQVQTNINNKAYDDLKKSKIGSDLYTMRGTQTLNPAQKQKFETFYGFT